jgi:hypothetical protein
MQVHDELVFEVPEEAVVPLAAAVRECMVRRRRGGAARRGRRLRAQLGRGSLSLKLPRASGWPANFVAFPRSVMRRPVTLAYIT